MGVPALAQLLTLAAGANALPSPPPGLDNQINRADFAALLTERLPAELPLEGDQATSDPVESTPLAPAEITSWLLPPGLMHALGVPSSPNPAQIGNTTPESSVLSSREAGTQTIKSLAGNALEKYLASARPQAQQIDVAPPEEFHLPAELASRPRISQLLASLPGGEVASETRAKLLQPSKDEEPTLPEDYLAHAAPDTQNLFAQNRVADTVGSENEKIVSQTAKNSLKSVATDTSLFAESALHSAQSATEQRASETEESPLEEKILHSLPNAEQANLAAASSPRILAAIEPSASNDELTGPEEIDAEKRMTPDILPSQWSKSLAPGIPPSVSQQENAIRPPTDGMSPDAANTAGKPPQSNESGTGFAAMLTAQTRPSDTTSPAPAQTTIDTPLRDQQWGQNLGDKLVWLAKNDQQSAQIHINPPQLGPVQITLNLSGDQASIAFASPHSEVRQAIQDAMPQLREMLSSAGINLGQTNVGSQQAQAGRDFARQFANENRSAGENAILPAENQAAQSNSGLIIQRGRGLVDLFA